MQSRKGTNREGPEIKQKMNNSKTLMNWLMNWIDKTDKLIGRLGLPLSENL